MARTYGGSFGPGITDINAYSQLTADVTGWSIGLVPIFGGVVFIKSDAVTDTPERMNVNWHSPAGSFRWLSLKYWRLDGTLTSSAERAFISDAASGGVPNAGDMELRWLEQTGSTYKIRLYIYTTSWTLQGTSSTTFNTATNYSIRLGADGIWIGPTGGTLVNELPGGIWVDGWLLRAGDGGLHRWAHGVGFSSPSQIDRPGVDVEAQTTLFPNGDGDVIQYGGTTGGVDCSAAANGDWSNWDEWSGAVAHNGDTDYNCLGGAAAGKELSDLSTVAVSRTPEGAMARSMSRANLASKTVDINFVLRNIANEEADSSTVNIGLFDTTWSRASEEYDSPPGSSDWADFIDSGVFNAGGASDHLQGGIKSPDTNGANDLHTALAFELCSVDDDPIPSSLPTPRSPIKHLIVR